MTDPYTQNLVNRNFYHSKCDITLRVVVVLDGLLESRGLHLIAPISRAFSKGTIIELIGTDDLTAAPGSTVEPICYIGFAEILNGGVLLTGDEIVWNGTVIGSIAGYDDTHMPNHQNTIVTMKKRISGAGLGIHVGDEIVIKGFSK